MQLANLAIGESAVVVGYQSCAPGYRMKLLSMGLTKGVHFTLVKRAPLGDPVELSLRGYALSLRKEEASVLLIKGEGCEDCDCG